VSVVTESFGRDRVRLWALSPVTILVAVTAIAGTIVKVWVYRSPLTIMNGDEALDGVMVRHFLHGDLTVFVWARPYGGTQELILSVPVFWLTGTSVLGLRVVPIVLSIIAPFLVWRVGLRTIGRLPAVTAACLFWVWPPFNYLVQERAQGFYASNIVYCALVLLLALRAVERPDRLRVGLFGLVVGLAYWQTAQIVPIVIPAVVWMIWKRREVLRNAWVAILAAIVGAAPWIVWNIGHGFESMQQHPGFHTYVLALRYLVSPILPMTVGLRAPYSQDLLIPSGIVTWIVYVGLVALFGYAAWRSRHRSISLLYLVVIFFPWLFAIPRKSSYITGFPQYTTVLTPVLALLVAQVATRYWRAAVVVAAALAISIVSLSRMEDRLKIPQPLPNAPRDFSPLISKLDALGVEDLWGDYWIVWRLNFDTHERITAVENQGKSVSFENGRAIPGVEPLIRYPPYQRKVEESACAGFVYWARTYDTVPMIAALERHGYRKIFVRPFVLFVPPCAGTSGSTS
jgi:hypothetical protein